jgi:hypothetical protein
LGTDPLHFDQSYESLGYGYGYGYERAYLTYKDSKEYSVQSWIQTLFILTSHSNLSLALWRRGLSFFHESRSHSRPTKELPSDSTAIHRPCNTNHNLATTSTAAARWLASFDSLDESSSTRSRSRKIVLSRTNQQILIEEFTFTFT